MGHKFKIIYKTFILLLVQNQVYAQSDNISKDKVMNNQNEKIVHLFKKEDIDFAKQNSGFIGIVTLDKVEEFIHINTRSEQANFTVHVLESFLDTMPSILKFNSYTKSTNLLLKPNHKYAIIAVPISALTKERYRLCNIKEL